MMFGWNYPPGVTGSEYAIAGPDYEQDYPEPCPVCGEALVQQGYRGEHWVVCISCDYQEDLDFDA
uniref:Uncharacterized protein n=1 Tax=viral metagenome TaxID=1070528 RepID=A0A6H1ZWZ5_9ZZZZ